MKYALWGFAAVGCLYGFHCLALWAERRGWIYYLKRRGSSGALGSALLEIQAVMEPSKRYVLEERRKDDSEAQESGDPPRGIDDAVQQGVSGLLSSSKNRKP